MRNPEYTINEGHVRVCNIFTYDEYLLRIFNYDHSFLFRLSNFAKDLLSRDEHSHFKYQTI